MGAPKPPTRRASGLRRIAEELNVSVSLFSKVLSGRLGTSGAHESKILAIHQKARELNYRKNVLAEALRTGRQNVTAVCVHRHGVNGSGIVEEMIIGIAGEAARHHQRLMIQYYWTAEELRAFCGQMYRNAVDGVIIGGVAHPELVEDLRALHDRGVPVVTIHDQQLGGPLANVGTDQVEVMRRATLHLIDQGCRRVAHIRVDDGEYELPEVRYRGYRQALAERRMSYRAELVVVAQGFYHDSGEQAVRALVAAGTEFDGLVCQSDQHAVAALNLLVRMGRRVPEQIKIIGVDNAPFCEFAIVPLSSVSQEFAARGREAVRLLMKRLNGEAISSVQVDPVVVTRASSACSKESVPCHTT